MENNIKDHIVVKCDKCGCEIIAKYDDLYFDWETWGGSERSMGSETEYKSTEYIHCPTCGEQIDIAFHLWEYPVGAVNHTEVYIERGQIISDIPDFSDKIDLLGNPDE